MIKKLSRDELEHWFDKGKRELEDRYSRDKESGGGPKYYKSNEHAMSALRGMKHKIENEIRVQYNKKDPNAPVNLTIGHVAEAIMKTISVVIMEVGDKQELAIYDYDRKIYTYELTTILNDCVVTLMGQSSQKILNDVSLTMYGLKKYALVHNPLPDYKIAVGNGIFNCITGELEPFDPIYTVLTRIDTDYVENPKHPEFSDGFTLEKMISDFANNDPEREKLIKQIVKTIILGYSIRDVIFIIIGEGGDGKSTFFTMVANMLGRRNVSYVDFSQINNPEIMLTTLNKKLAIGMDNDDNVYVQKTSRIKQIASKEPMSYTRKYQGAIAAPFLASFVQLVNTFPSFSGGGHAIERRLVTFKVERSHTMEGTANPNIESNYIWNKEFLEYALWYFLNEETSPYFNGYSTVDRKVSKDSLYEDDLVGQYVDMLIELDIVGEVNKAIPNTHLYQGFVDYVRTNSPSSHILSSRTFQQKVRPRLSELGYEVAVDKNGKAEIPRPKTLEKIGEYNIGVWGSLANGQKLSEVIEGNQPSRYYKRVRDVKNNKSGEFNVYRVSPITFFGLDDEIKRDYGMSPSDTLIVEGLYQEKVPKNKFVEEKPKSKKVEKSSIKDAPIDIGMLYKDVDRLFQNPDEELRKDVISRFKSYQIWFDESVKYKNEDIRRFIMVIDQEKLKWGNANNNSNSYNIEIKSLADNEISDVDTVVGDMIDKFNEVVISNL